MELAEFKRIRSKLGLTQADAAEVFGLAGPTVISNIETGFRKPSRLFLSLISLLDEMPIEAAKELADQLAMKNKWTHDN